MQKSESVFWLTLVDFLVQVIFFGLFMAVALVAVEDRLAAERPDRDITDSSAGDPGADYAVSAGYSNVAELTDELTRLVPASQFREFQAAVVKAGGIEQVLRAADSIDAVNISRRGLGPPPCLVREGGEGYLSIGKVRAYDDKIEFVTNTPQLAAVLAGLKLEYKDVRVLSLDSFIKTFASLRTKTASCVHYIDIEEHTEKSSPGRAIQTAFNPGRLTQAAIPSGGSP